MTPDILGVYDESSERLLCPRWVKMAAESRTAPAPKDIFSVQAISGDGDEVWLHTHGLARCGITELEILNSDREHYKNHHDLIQTYASRLLEKKTRAGDPCYLGILSEDIPVVVTCIPWTAAIKFYPDITLGGIEDRKEGHNSLYSPVFVYTSPEDEKNHTVSMVSVFDDLFEDNPLFFYSDEETFRMQAAAQERFHCVRKAVGAGNPVIAKIALKVDEDKVEENGSHEHIWFEVKKFDGDRFNAVLTQDTYFVSGISKGDERWFTASDVTDWLIYTEEFTVSPDKAYLLQ